MSFVQFIVVVPQKRYISKMICITHTKSKMSAVKASAVTDTKDHRLDKTPC